MHVTLVSWKFWHLKKNFFFTDFLFFSEWENSYLKYNIRLHMIMSMLKVSLS